MAICRLSPGRHIIKNLSDEKTDIHECQLRERIRIPPSFTSPVQFTWMYRLKPGTDLRVISPLQETAG